MKQTQPLMPVFGDLTKEPERIGYKSQSFLSLIWILWRAHRKAKKQNAIVTFQIFLGKDF